MFAIGFGILRCERHERHYGALGAAEASAEQQVACPTVETDSVEPMATEPPRRPAGRRWHPTLLLALALSFAVVLAPAAAPASGTAAPARVESATALAKRAPGGRATRAPAGPLTAGRRPAADAAAEVVVGDVRFTVLSDRLVRLERRASQARHFDDRATFAVVARRTRVPEFRRDVRKDRTVISTGLLNITYVQDGANEFTRDNLRIDFADGGSWHPGLVDQHNLKGAKPTGHFVVDPSTCPACRGRDCGTSADGSRDAACDGKGCRCMGGQLDCWEATGPEECPAFWRSRLSDGLLSRSGYSVVDDTQTLRFSASGWWEEPGSAVLQDLYFLYSGQDYAAALASFAEVSGPPAMPPRAAFGVWWSLFSAFSEKQLLDEVLQGYADHDLPLNVVVLDMDWHVQPQEEACNAWGAWDWDTTQFPDPQGFIRSLHGHSNPTGHPLLVSLNIHPQAGVTKCSGKYETFATACNGSCAMPDKKLGTFMCDMSNKAYVEALWTAYMSDDEYADVDFWWTDYAGCGFAGLLPPGGDAGTLHDATMQSQSAGGWSLQWNNEVYANLSSRGGTRRPLTFSRPAGIGTQRAPISFSGDALQTWQSLAWEVESTALNANSLSTYMSHDVGGFHPWLNSSTLPGTTDAQDPNGSELYLRWIQFGVFSPIFRTHGNHAPRKIWEFVHYEEMRDAFILRNCLVPYAYTAARTAYDTGLGLVYPTYIRCPADDQCYEFPMQYWYGPSLLVAPITAQADEITRTASKKVYLPDVGDDGWATWSGKRLQNGISKQKYGLGEIPLFARGGAVLPMQTMASVGAHTGPDPLIWVLFAGAAQGTGTVYEDDGATEGYRRHEYAKTALHYHVDRQGDLVLRILPSEGTFMGKPRRRAHILQLRGFEALTRVEVDGVVAKSGNATRQWYTNSIPSLCSPAGAAVVDLGAEDDERERRVTMSFRPVQGSA